MKLPNFPEVITKYYCKPGRNTLSVINGSYDMISKDSWAIISYDPFTHIDKIIGHITDNVCYFYFEDKVYTTEQLLRVLKMKAFW
jgi:hypothetical protein